MATVISLSKPAEVDLEAYVDESQSLSLTLKQENGSAFDLTGSELIFTLTNGATTLLSFTTATPTGLVITNAAGGVVTLSLTEEQSGLLPEGRIAKYKIRRRINSTNKRLMIGYFIGKK